MPHQERNPVAAKDKCPECGSRHVWVKNNAVPCRQGRKRRYLCAECGVCPTGSTFVSLPFGISIYSYDRPLVSVELLS